MGFEVPKSLTAEFLRPTDYLHKGEVKIPYQSNKSISDELMSNSLHRAA